MLSKRVKEVQKYATFGAIIGGTITSSVAIGITESAALIQYMKTICHHSYDHLNGARIPPFIIKDCEAKCFYGKLIELNCELMKDGIVEHAKIKPSKTMFAPAREAGIEAHNSIWYYGGAAFTLTAAVTGVLLGGVSGSIYGFFKKIPPSLQTKEEKPFAARNLERFQNHPGYLTGSMVEKIFDYIEDESKIPANAKPASKIHKN